MALPSVDRGRLSWWVLGLVLAGALLYVVFSFVGTFVFGVFIYYATRPIYRRIRRRTDHPNVAAAISLFALVLPALALVAYALSIVFREANRYATGTDIDPAEFGIDPALISRVADPQELVGAVTDGLFTGPNLDALIDSLASATQTLTVLGVGLVHLFVMLALAFYLLRDDHRLSRWFYLRFGDDTGVVESYLRTVDRDFTSIFFGNILNAVLTGTIGVIVYSALNVFAPPGIQVPAPALVGLLAGVASLIPVVGMKLVYVPVALFMGLRAVLVGGGDPLAFVLAFVVLSFVVVDTIPDLVLRPYVSGRTLHVGAVMLAYTLGPLLFGWYGIFLMPMLLVLVVHFARIVLPELLAGTPIQPYAVDPSHMSSDPGEFSKAELHPGSGTGVGGEPTGTGGGGETTGTGFGDETTGTGFGDEPTGTGGGGEATGAAPREPESGTGVDVESESAGDSEKQSGTDGQEE